MGVEYYLAREDNRTLFRIGKFSEISDLFRGLGQGNARNWDWLPREVPPEADLLIRIAIDGASLGDIDPDVYAKELARRIYAFTDGHSVCLLSDANDADELHDHYADDDRLRVVDSVYTSSWNLPKATKDHDP